MSRQTNALISRFNTQKGVTLIIALVMLLVMTSLGVTTMSGSVLQERIASNHRQQYIARANAEAALLSAESYLNTLPAGGVGEKLTLSDIEGDFGVVAVGLYTTKVVNGFGPVNLAFDVTNDANWDNLNSIEVSNTVPPAQFSIALQNPGARLPRVIVQYLGCEGTAEECDATHDDYDPYFSFRIVAIGWGTDINAYSVLQAIYLSKQ
jgi:type IV pilus assembly protein PilX